MRLLVDEGIVRASTADKALRPRLRGGRGPLPEEAWTLVEGGLVADVVITDHLMPGMTGTDLTRILKEGGPGRRS